MTFDKKRVLAAFDNDSTRVLKVKEVGESIGVTADERADLRKAMRQLVESGDLLQHPGRRFSLPGEGSLIEGRVQLSKKGYGWLLPDDEDIKDAFLPPNEIAGLLDGDRVLCRISPTPKGSEAKVMRVLARAHSTVTGSLRREGRATYVESVALGAPILIPDGHLGDTKAITDGTIVEVLIEQWPTAVTSAVGRVVRTLGAEGEISVEIERILIDAGVVRAFSPEAEREAAGYPHDPSKEDIEGREDLRKIPLVTIDGETAKDFDDAVYAERTAKGTRVIVAIADVSHYVRDGTALDADARSRGTSIYYPGRVIPMLPFSISDNLCSLVPNRDRLCMFAEMLVDKHGAILETRFGNGVMRSHARLTYTTVAKFLAHDAEVAASLEPSIREGLVILDEVSRAIRSVRFARGALDFDIGERVIVVDETGEPTAIHPLERNDAHRLIEDLMIAANEAVARHFDGHEWPCVYRIHEPPDEDKLERFLSLARAVVKDSGLTPKKVDVKSARGLSILVADLKQHRLKGALDYLLLRAMMQAKYAPDNLGHFGLGSTAYLHFTSPIRRYPDLVVHRLLKEHIASKRKLTNGRIEELAEYTDAISASSSELERRATGIERKVSALYGAWFMRDRIGELFEGVVSGCAEFGVFVRLDEPDVEGLVHVRVMGADYFTYDELHMRLRGNRTGFELGLGDRVRVRVTSVDLTRRQVELNLDRILVQHGKPVDKPPPGVVAQHPQGARGGAPHDDGQQHGGSLTPGFDRLRQQMLQKKGGGRSEGARGTRGRSSSSKENLGAKRGGAKAGGGKKSGAKKPRR
jgi:ribonuclease R